MLTEQTPGLFTQWENTSHWQCKLGLVSRLHEVVKQAEILRVRESTWRRSRVIVHFEKSYVCSKPSWMCKITDFSFAQFIDRIRNQWFFEIGNDWGRIWVMPSTSVLVGSDRQCQSLLETTNQNLLSICETSVSEPTWSSVQHFHHNYDWASNLNREVHQWFGQGLTF